MPRRRQLRQNLANPANWRLRGAVALAAAVTLITAAAPPAQTPVRGLDHMPLAVQNLAQAQADFTKLGFTLKPGRAHTDGIRNAHAKFANGTEIELITAANPASPLATEYTAFLRAGSGPAFWSLYAPDFAVLTTTLATLGTAPVNTGDIVNLGPANPPHRLFFADRLASPTDRPAYFRHENTATRLAAIWLAQAPFERALLQRLGLPHQTTHPCAPFATTAETFTLPEGDQVNIIPAPPSRPASREILAATVRAASLPTARAVLMRNDIPVIALCHSLWVAPAYAQGAWLEFRGG